MPIPLESLPFIDLYVRLDRPDQAFYRSREKGKTLANQLVPAEYQTTIDLFMSAVNDVMKGDKSDAAVTFDGVRCRLSRQYLADDTVWVCARRITHEIPDIDQLGILPNVCQHMKSLGKRDGLIIISGATGNGKTTTGVALMAHFLRQFGGTAVTIEDPVEFILKGRHGDSGQCFQVEIKDDEEWATCLKRALRWAPRYIYVGEIRTPKGAEQLLRTATTGHLVMTTVHAGSPEEAIMGISYLAEQSMGPSVNNMLATGFTAIAHQTLRDSGPVIRYAYTEPDSPGDPIRSLIRDSKVGMISTYVDRIAARLAGGENATGVRR